MKKNDQLAIPPVPPSVLVEDLVSTVNDRFRRVQQMIAGVGGENVLYGTHSARLNLKPADHPQAVYFETDRNYVGYVSDGRVWRFTGGIMYGALGFRPTGLTAADEGFYFLTSSAPRVLYRWTSGVWVVVIGAIPWSFLGAWSNTHSYKAGDVVTFAATLWISTDDDNVNNTPTLPASAPPIWVMANWNNLASVAAFAGNEWDEDRAYTAGAVVTYLGDLWVAISGTTGTKPTQGDLAWSQFDTDGIFPSSNGKIGYGLNMRFDGTRWITGQFPDNACAAILVDSVTGKVSLHALEHVANGTAPNNPQPQTQTATALESHKFLEADPLSTGASSPAIPHISAIWPIVDTAVLLVNNPADSAHAKQGRFDLSLLANEASRVYSLPDFQDKDGHDIVVAGVDPPHGGTGQSAQPGAAGAHSWAGGKLLIGDGADVTALLAVGIDGKVLTIDSGANPTGLLAWESPTGAAAGTYGDGIHVAQVTVDAGGRITGITSVAISAFAGGASGTVPLAKITGGGSNGSLTVVDGIITAITNPT